MSTPFARKAWQALVGFILGGTAANLAGVTSVALYQAYHGYFTFVHLLFLSVRERVVFVSVPIVLAVLLWRSRPYVAVGTLLAAGAYWFLTAPIPWGK